MGGKRGRFPMIESSRRSVKRGKARKVGVQSLPSPPKKATAQTEDASQQLTYAGLKRLAWEHASEILRDQRDVFVQGFLAGYMCSGVGLRPDRPEKK